MSLPKTVGDLLTELANRESGQLDVSKIPTEVIDDVLELVDSLFAYKPGDGLVLNNIMKSELNADEIESAEKISSAFASALLGGRASLLRLTNGRIGVGLGLDADESYSSAKALDFTDFEKVKIKVYWWGIRIHLDHKLTQAIIEEGKDILPILILLGIPPWIALIIAGAVVVLNIFDQGNGVYFYTTWPGLWFATPA